VLVFFIAGGAVLILWQNIAMSPTLSGVGEGLRSLISSPQPAVLQSILVEPYQVVNKGDAIAIIVPADPRIQFDLFRSELDIARIRSQPSIAEGNAMNFERIRVELLRTKSELAIAREKLVLAERDLQRNTPLFHEKLVSEDIYDLSLKTRDMHKVEVDLGGAHYRNGRHDPAAARRIRCRWRTSNYYQSPLVGPSRRVSPPALQD
jgi:multidrug efflux pump subunit AcrA (membrane-fusion protein)